MIRKLITDLFDSFLQLIAVLLIGLIAGGFYFATYDLFVVGTLQAVALGVVAAFVGAVVTCVLLGPMFVLLDIRDSLRKQN